MAHVTDFREAGFSTLLEELEWRGLISQSPSGSSWPGSHTSTWAIMRSSIE